MKQYISKFLLGLGAVSMMALASCTGDLNQEPKDPNTLTSSEYEKDPKGFIGAFMGKCYSGLAVSGQQGAGSSEITSPDAGMSQYTRALFMANEFPTDEISWIYSSDSGVADCVKTNWSAGNAVVDLIYSRFYTHVAVCNDFIRFVRSHEDEMDAELKDYADQFILEARVLRDYTYYNIIDIFGRAAVAWDDQAVNTEPLQAESRAALFNKVVADLEDVLKVFPKTTPVYGRIGYDAVEALLMRFRLNEEVFTDGASKGYDKAYQHAVNIIARHQGGGFQGSGLANSYLSLFCKNNHIFVAGGNGYLPAQNEILWAIPQEYMMTESYGATNFLVMGLTFGGTANVLNGKGFCQPSWYGTSNAWGCMHARQQFSEKFDFVDGVSSDGRAVLWLTENAGWKITNDKYDNLTDGYLCMKFTNVECEANGNMPLYMNQDSWQVNDPNDPSQKVEVTPAFIRAGLPNPAATDFVDTDLPVIRLAEVYLTAAECSLRGAGSRVDGLQYANYVRERAGVPAWGSADFTLANMIDERGRELYLENVRRTDLIRFDLFTGSTYLWNWKGGQASGTSIDARYRLFPIPTNVIAAYDSEYVQNPGF